MSAQTAEIENRLAANADENVITLEDGMQVELVPLKTRQAFALFRIVLKGTYQGNALLAAIAQQGSDGLVGKVAMSAALSVPDADDEAIEFLQSIVKPVHQEQSSKVRDYLENPSLDDLVTILHALTVKEAPHVADLSRQLTAMLSLATKTGQIR